MAVITVWAMYMAMIMAVVVAMSVVVVAVRAVNVILLGHASYSWR